MAICLYDKIKIPSQIDQIDIGQFKQWVLNGNNR